MKDSIYHNHLTVKTEDDVIMAMECTSRLAKSLGFLPNDQILLRLAVEEAIVNALEYGDDDTIDIMWKSHDENLIISVKQDGIPFIINREETINYNSRGRGLQLIVNIMDEVKVVQDGKKVILQMKKRFGSEAIKACYQM